MNKKSSYNLKPSQFSSDGFLGTDTRPLEKIIEEDLAALRQNKISKEKLVSALKRVHEKAKNAFGTPVQITSQVTATYYESRGFTPSPFKGDGLFEKGETQVRDSVSEESFIITSLSINLIEKHAFFQGKGSRYRIDPEKAIRILFVQ